MLTNYVSCHYVVTSVTFYHSAVVDLTRSQTVHAVEHDPCCPDPTKLSAEECKAVHYGLCSPLLKLPSFSIPPASTSSPPSPVTPKGSLSSPLSSTPSSPGTPKGNISTVGEIFNISTPQNKTPSPLFTQKTPISNPQSPSVGDISKMTSPTVVTSNSANANKVDIEVLDPVSLLAVDLEGQLEALVSSFVAQDKVRLAARKKAESAAGNSKTSAGKTVSSIKKYDKKVKVKDDRSSDDDSLSSDASLSGKSNGSSKKAVTQNQVKPLLPDTTDIAGDTSLEGALDQMSKHLNTFAALYEESLRERATSPPLKSSVFPALKPSPEYQQTGVKAQITKFTSKEKDVLQNSPSNSLERRQVQKPRPIVQDAYLPSLDPPRSGPLTLDALQELLLNSSAPEPIPQHIQTTVFQNSSLSSVSYSEPASSKNSLPAAASHFNENLVPFIGSETGRIVDQSKPLKLNANDIYNPQIVPKPGQEHVQSAVDYAINRMQNVHQVNSNNENKAKPVKNGHLVSEAKTMWENISNQKWNEHFVTTDIDSNMADPLRDSYQRGGHKRTLSMEGLLDVPSPSIPHPKLTTAQKQHIKERSLSPTDRHSHTPIRPFLTKGSVAERVLLFECAPDRALERTSSGNKTKSNLISTWRPGTSDVQTKTQFWEVVADSDKNLNLSHHGASSKDKENTAPTPRTSSLRKAVKSGKQGSTQIPKFHFPDGKPQTPQDIEIHLKKVAAVFAGLNEGKASREEFSIITKACGLPLYWKLPLFLAARGDKKSAVSCDAFLEYWRRVVNTCHDEASKFVYILSKGKRSYLLNDDFFPMMQDVIDSHPGLTFLKEATEFHSRYIHTVIARIYYCVNRSWSGKLTAPELRRSNFLQVLATLEDEEDINQITDYFSYEHFYVIYCKFWELDKDHDLFIDQNDLKVHSGGALSTRVIQRIFSGAVTRGPKQKEGKMSYTEFVWFLISEEDKRHPRSIEYWFRCMDLDGDGLLSMYELEYFYAEQLQRLEALGIETLPFNDCLCQMLDIIKPKVPGKVSLADLKKCKMTPIFFDTFFNLEKYLDHEQRDPFASQREHDGDGPELSDWDRYAAEEYELLVAEEGAADQQDELMYDDYDEEVVANMEKMARAKRAAKPVVTEAEDDDYDYADSDDYHY